MFTKGNFFSKIFFDFFLSYHGKLFHCFLYVQISVERLLVTINSWIHLDDASNLDKKSKEKQGENGAEDGAETWMMLPIWTKNQKKNKEKMEQRMGQKQGISFRKRDRVHSNHIPRG